MYTIIPNTGYSETFYTIRRDDGKIAVVSWHVRSLEGGIQLMARQQIDKRRDGTPIYTWPYCGVISGAPLSETIPAAFNERRVILGAEFWT